MKELVIHSAEISAGTALLTSEQDEWLKKAKSDPFERTKVSVSDPGFTVNGNEVFAVGAGPDTATYHLSLTVPEGTRAIKIDALPDPARPNQGPGRASSGNFILTEVSIKEAKVSYAKTDFTQPGYGAEFLQDGNSETGWAIAGGYGKPHSLVLELDHPVSGTLQLDLEFGSKQWVNHTLGHFSVSSTSVEGASRFLIPDDIRAIVNKTERSAAEESKVSDWYKTVSLRFRESNAKIAKVERELRQIRESLPTAMVMREGLGKTEAPIRHRGEFLSPEEVVASGTPAALGPVAGGNRLALAKWMVSPKNPLTARVQVNRIWEMLFGRGIVETSENFGTQGAKPSHPELLDWLAGTYIESGWDTKKLIRLIVRSNTYQQSSATNPKLTKIDPYNVLLARGPRFRLPAESIRDVALASSGLLNKKIGGPPVFPFQPDGVWDSPYSGERWMQSKGADLYRRSIYTFWKRTAPYPSFIAFDAPSREQCTVRRIRTNSPLQALATLNDPGLFDVAKAMGERFKQRPGGLSAQVSAEFRSVLSRNPTPTELNRLTGLFTKVESKNGEGAAWTMLGNVILNLDEALTKE